MKNFNTWKKDLKNQLITNSSTIKTCKGSIEYSLTGDKRNPIIAVMHGAPGGYDQCAIENVLIDHGFCILAWSRPGYLRTPLSVGSKFDQQADALIALLDKLKIDKVAVLGISAGGAPALYTAIKYPQRTWALINEVALSQAYHINFLSKYFVKLLNNRIIYILKKLFQQHPSWILKLFLFLESSASQAAKKLCIKKALRSPKALESSLYFLETLSFMKERTIGTFNDLDLYESLPLLAVEKISAPTLIIQGKYDKDVPINHALFLKKNIPHAELIFFEGSHLFWLAPDYEKIIEKKVSFLKSTSKSLNNISNTQH